MIDPVTNLVEITRVLLTKSWESAQAFRNTWLLRYPLCCKVIADGGPEFTGHEWEFMLMDYGITKECISAHTPTANAVIESSHCSMGQLLRTILENNSPRSMAEMNIAINNALAQTMHAMQCSSNTSLQGLAPGLIVFGRDMLLNIPIATDIISISENRQLQTDLRLQQEN